MKHRVLIVDDVIFSIDVLKHFINSYGIKTNCVGSGQQAIDLIREGKVTFNAVFIDQMMPEMDGVQTAREIRKLGTKYAGTLPLIAVSANAAVDDKNTFLLKGFQDFISKPIDVSQLDTVIKRWLLSDGASKKPEKLMVSGIFNQLISGINIKRCPEHFGGDEGLFAEFLRSFTDNIPELLRKTQVGAADMKNYAIYVHGIKGSCLNICADELSERAGELEKAANSNDSDYISSHNAGFIESAAELIENIKKALNKTPS
jgi:CheY-like chemotaxis protein